MTPTQQLVAALLAMVVLAFAVGMRLLAVRIAEMRARRVHPQAVATSLQVSVALQNVQAADNFRNLFEVPVLFYALCATSLALNHVPMWLPFAAWAFVLLRYAHSIIQCTYNKVMHRFVVFITGFALLVATWMAFFASWLVQHAD
jgi:hypothetical protein